MRKIEWIRHDDYEAKQPIYFNWLAGVGNLTVPPGKVEASVVKTDWYEAYDVLIDGKLYHFVEQWNNNLTGVARDMSKATSIGLVVEVAEIAEKDKPKERKPFVAFPPKSLDGVLP